MPQVPQERIFSPFHGMFRMPFYYDAVSFFWNYFRVPAERASSHLHKTGLNVAQFSDLNPDEAIVSLNFQTYISNLGMTLARVLEVEFNIHVYPVSKESETPLISFADYIKGQEQTKWIGGFRLHVPADDKIAVEAGMGVFGERKFLTKFTYEIPVPNNPSQKLWEYTTFAPGVTPPETGSPDPKDVIYSLKGDLSKLGQPILTNPSPMTLYSLLPGGPDHPPGYGKLNASRWNILGLDNTWLDLEKSLGDAIQITYGTSGHPMQKDMQELIGNTPACCIRYYQSPPAAIENRAFWVEPLAEGEKSPVEGPYSR